MLTTHVDSSAEVKNEWNYTSNHRTRLHGVDRVTLLYLGVHDDNSRKHNNKYK